MTAPFDVESLLSEGSAQDLALMDIPGLRPVVVMGAERQVRLLDCFDGSLRRSQRVLLEHDGQLELRDAAGGVLSQPAGEERFVPGLPEGPVKAALADVSPLRRLLPVAEARLRPGTLALLDEEDKTRVRATLCEITSRGESFVIVTPQGLRGYDKALEQLREGLERLGCGPARGRDITRRMVPAASGYSGKPDTGLRDDHTVFEAATDIIHAHLAVLRANEPGIIADLDTEFLHDYRVALRKIRSVVSLLDGVYAQGQTADLKARFSALMARTGALRDLDVKLLERDTFRAMLPEMLHPGLEAMFARLGEDRQAELARLTAFLQSDAYAEEMASLARIFASHRLLRPGPLADRPVRATGSRLIQRRYRRIRQTAAILGPDTPDATVHALRIQCKKLRYLMELFAPLYPPAQIGPLLRPLKRLQDTLGRFNDYSVQQASLRRFAAGLGAARPAHPLEIAQSVGALVAALHHRQLEERAKVGGALAAFADDATKAEFRKLFQEERTTE